MYPGHWAQITPDKPAVVMAGTDDIVTYAELDQRSIRLARLWHDSGLRPGDGVALFMENHPRFLEVVWGAMRSGLRITPVNRYLTAPEAAYIVNDCDARAIVTSTAMAAVAAELADQIPGCKLRLSVDGLVDGYASYEDALVGVPADPLDDEPLGQLMLYSSGTTGRPKGAVLTHRNLLFMSQCYYADIDRLDERDTHLCAAPVSHGAGLYALPFLLQGAHQIVLPVDRKSVV